MDRRTRNKLAETYTTTAGLKLYNGLANPQSNAATLL